MSGSTCTCFSGKSPLGLPSCVPSFGKDTVIIVMDERAADGTYNEIKLTDLVDGKLPESFVTAKLNEDDQTKQWFMSAAFDEVNPVRSEPVFDEIGSIPQYVRQGNLIWTGTIVAPPAYLKALGTHTCGTNKVFFTVDAAGNLKGKEVENAAGEKVFRGRKIQKGTMYTMYNEGAKDEKERIMLVFMVAETENDADFGFLSVGSMSFNFHSLPQIYVTELEFVGALETEEFTFTAKTQFGSFGEKTHIPGLVVGDIDIFNVTDDASVTPLTLVENVDDETYTATYAAQTEGDTLRLSLDKDNYWAEPIEGVIPT